MCTFFLAGVLSRHRWIAARGSLPDHSRLIPYFGETGGIFAKDRDGCGEGGSEGSASAKRKRTASNKE
jgi:hypothetical protein